MHIEAKDLFAALAHETRLRCLMLLLRQGELCVCELTHALAAAQPHISRHLAHLRSLGLIRDRREGLWIYYRINPDLPDWIQVVLRETEQGVQTRPPFNADTDNLCAMSDRPGAPKCA